MKTITIVNVATGRTLSTSFRCTLARGRYSWSLAATDLAGNKAKTVSAVLVVK